jgi:PAS domain S-box-containing protein
MPAWWTGAGLAMNLPGKTSTVLRRYSLALVLAGLALFLRGSLPFLAGAPYQVPVTAVVLSAWYGGRGPGLFALLIYATANLYFFIPPVHSFELHPDYAFVFFTFLALCLLLIEFSAGRMRVLAQLHARQEMLDLAQTAARAVAFDWFIGARESQNRWSPELEAMYGVEPGTFDRTFEGWKKLIHPDDWPAVKLALKRAHESGDVAAEYRVVYPDGTAHWLRAKGRMFFDAKGRPKRMVGFMTDITDWRHAEERQAKLAAIVESSDDAIISKDLNGIITTWNTGAERIFGYAAREVIGQSVTILVPPDRVDEVRGILERIRRGERVHHFETVRRRKDGTLLDISLSVSPIIDESGNVVGASKVARDISERKRAEDALREKDDALEMARTELARAARLTTLGELTTSIAHEVGQPLGAMVASAGAGARWLAADPPAMAEARAALDNIVADGKRAREVIARIRSLAKRQEPRKDRLDINQKITEVLALTEHELRSHDIVVRTELDRTLPRVTGDRVQLQQVLLNLIVNAVEAMSAVHDRSRELTIVSRQDDSKAVLVEVRDSGNGLDARRAEQVFEAFYTTKAEGIGIGLSIGRSIIEAHGGRLWASANAPHGAVFRFSLPVTEETVS